MDGVEESEPDQNLKSVRLDLSWSHKIHAAFSSEIKKNAGEAAFGRARRRFMDAVKEDIKFRWCERRGCRGFGGRLGDWLWPPLRGTVDNT